MGEHQVGLMKMADRCATTSKLVTNVGPADETRTNNTEVSARRNRFCHRAAFAVGTCKKGMSGMMALPGKDVGCCFLCLLVQVYLMSNHR